MGIVIDTPIWSSLLRRRSTDSPEAAALQRIILDKQVILLGMVRQEILSGIVNKRQFEIVRQALGAFPDLPLTPRHYELAAEYSNTCRAGGVHGSSVDFLICAAATLSQAKIYSTDRDFEHYEHVLPVSRFDPAKS